MESKERVRYAVVGLGNIAQVALLPSFEHAEDNSELVALVSSDEVKLEELGKRYDVPHRGSYAQLEQVLRASGADAIYLAVPNTLHRDLTIRAAKAGVHVLCEKPMAMSVHDCEAMIQACDDARRYLMIAYRLHFEEATLRAIELVREGAIGEPRFFSSVFGQQVRGGDIRTRRNVGGGAFFDLGIYCVNAARNVFGDEPIEAFAMVSEGDERFEAGVDATAAALLRFPGDRTAQFTASHVSSPVDEFRIVGTKGNLRVEPAFTYSGDIVHHLTVEGKERMTLFSARDQFGPELYSFSRCILDGEEPEPSGEEGLLDVRVLEALAYSARDRRPVALTPYARKRRPSMEQEVRMPKVAQPKTVHAPSPAT
jgi:predicted dehydrogenase